MNTIIAKIKVAVSAMSQSIKGYYGRHRLMMLSGITILSILLIVWARFGFTLQFGQSSAINIGIVIRSDKSEVDRGEAFRLYGNFPPMSVCWLTSNPDIFSVPLASFHDSPWFFEVPSIPSTTKFTMRCIGLGEASVTVKLKSDTYTCLQNPNQECVDVCAQPITNGGTCPGAQFCCAKKPPITATLSASPTTAPQGGTVKLTWTSTNATSCTNAYGVFDTGNTPNGSADGKLPYVGTSTKFIVKCIDGQGGEAYSNEVIVNLTVASQTAPPPTATLTPTPTATLTPTPTATLTPTPTLVCAPVSQTVNVGQAAYLSASGGNDSVYYWQADGQTRTGSQISFVFTTVGAKQVVVTTAAVDGNTPQAICVVNVVTPVPTGGVGTVQTGPGDAMVMALLVSGIVTLLYVSYTHTSMFRRREIDSITRKKDPLDFRG